MKRLVEVATATTAAVMLTGCGYLSGSQENHTSPNDPTLERLFDDAQAYWEKQGIARAAGGLVTLREPGDKFYCHNTDETQHSPVDVLREPTTDIARYCRGEDATVIMSDSYQSALERATEKGDLPAEAYRWLIAAHEKGHHIMDVLNEDPGEFSEEAAGELRADCFAGSAVAGLAPDHVPSIANYLGGILGVAHHGTGAQMRAAFEVGAATPDGANCHLYYDGAPVSHRS